MPLFSLNAPKTMLIVIDVQEKIFAQVERGCEVLHALLKLVKGCQLLDVDVMVTEQYPQGLGKTLLPLRQLLEEKYQPWEKITFSALGDENILHYVQTLPHTQWIVVGLEAHICVLQTVKQLLQMDKEVTVINDAISSRSIYDFSTAIAEMRDDGARISSTETVLFELLQNSNHPQFKSVSQLIQSCCSC